MCVARHSHDWMVYDTFREWSHFEVYGNENTNLLCVGIKKTRSFERKKINRWKPKPIRAHSILCAVPIRFFFAATTFISFLICVAAGVCAFRSLRALSNCILCVGVFTFLFKFIRTLSCPVITIASFTCQETVYALYGILLHISVLFPLFFFGVLTTSLQQMWKSLQSKYGKSHQPEDSHSCVLCNVLDAWVDALGYFFWSTLSECVRIGEVCNGILCSCFNSKIAQPNSEIINVKYERWSARKRRQKCHWRMNADARR